ncbi:methyl-accepting chemotaxis protein [Planctobacterium marinum]|uniref:Methyl-accepting chemotaxis protein n=1 Tax=Planctobacterium marinum TaxID=1631968 RepID=A0AA48KRA8_9ALTE|nr:hypothetical protein MACH26_28740 [Planctobacterium marinum]
MNNLKLAQLLGGAMLCLALLPLLIVSFIASQVASESLTAQSFAQLQSIRAIKAEAIERHFTQSKAIIKTVSTTPGTLAAAKQLKTSFRQYMSDTGRQSLVAGLRQELSGYYQNEFGARYQQVNNRVIDTQPLLSGINATAVALQHDYIYGNSAPLGAKDELYRAPGNARYHQFHEQFHPFFRQTLQEFGYYDIFLVDPATGVIFYSVFKELDYATSLTTGPYANTNFARVFKKALQDQQIHSVDYEPYLPSYEAPASFQAAPVMDGDKLEAILIFQLPIEPVNAIMTSRSGLGETGETYLVGEDRLMRSDSFLSPDTHTVSASFANPATGKVNTEAVQQAFNGKEGTRIIIDYLGNPVLSSWQLVDLGDFKWAILAEIDQAEAFAASDNLNTTMLIIIVAAVVIIGFAGIRISALISTPIINMAKTMDKVQQSGDFSLRIRSAYQNELGVIGNAFDKLLSNLNSAFSASEAALKQVSEGDYQARVVGQYSGDLLQLKQGIDATIAAIETASEESKKQRQIATAKAEEAAQQQQNAEQQQRLAQQKADEAARLQQQAMQAKQEAEEKALDALNATQEAEKQKQLANEKAIEAQTIAQQASEAAVAANRIKQALDNVSTFALLCDKQHKVIYINHSMHNKLMELAETHATISPDTILNAPLRRLLNEDATLVEQFDNSHKRAQLTIAGAIFECTANLIVDDQGETLGTVLELVDRTAEISAEKEIDAIVESAASGDLSVRVSETGKSGFILKLSGGLNKLVSISEQIIAETSEVLEGVANGDLSHKLEGEYQGAFATLQRDINATVDKLIDVVADINQSAATIADNAADIAAGNMQMTDRTQNQASSLEETSASMEQMTSSVKGTAQNASNANRIASDAQQLAIKGGEVCEQSISSMAAIEDASKKINDIIGVIDEIAFQTNLLALNASVEAARAGEQGRGFAVVASEVRNLAQRSASAAKEIKDLILDSVNKVQDGTLLVNRSGQTLQDIIAAVNSVKDSIMEIATATDEQSTGISQVSRSIVEMEDATQQSAAFVEETSASADSMATEAQQMQAQLQFFKL